jgi:hypothetical protein
VAAIRRDAVARGLHRLPATRIQAVIDRTRRGGGSGRKAGREASG